MPRYLSLLLFIGLGFWGCASTNKDAIKQQKDFIKRHPTWKGHDFGFDNGKPKLDVNEIIETINQEKINSKSDTIIKIKNKLND
tara:strand:- start:757 stop:1008 length:252 start_codon:yes stop_codon:yes gene_type:complete